MLGFNGFLRGASIHKIFIGKCEEESGEIILVN
jgi:hypothetical protein